jgi:hypothetical protein
VDPGTDLTEPACALAYAFGLAHALPLLPAGIENPAYPQHGLPSGALARSPGPSAARASPRSPAGGWCVASASHESGKPTTRMHSSWEDRKARLSRCRTRIGAATSAGQCGTSASCTCREAGNDLRLPSG